jgi:hypothetical protein
MGLLSTRSKRQRNQATGLRTLRFTLTKQDNFSIPAQERKPRQMKFYLTSQEQHIHDTKEAQRQAPPTPFISTNFCDKGQSAKAKTARQDPPLPLPPDHRINYTRSYNKANCADTDNAYWYWASTNCADTNEGHWALGIHYDHGNTDYGSTDYGNTDYGSTDYGNTDYGNRGNHFLSS